MDNDALGNDVPSVNAATVVTHVFVNNNDLQN